MSPAPRASIPPTAAWLGSGGLLPFVLLALAILIDNPRAAFFSAALITYGAVILSFVGALHWAFAMTLGEFNDESSHRRRNETLIWSTGPALLAWAAVLLPIALGSFLLIAGFVAHYWQDRAPRSLCQTAGLVFTNAPATDHLCVQLSGPRRSRRVLAITPHHYFRRNGDELV